MAEVKHNQRIREYWNQETVESMYDKVLLKAEIELIQKHIREESRILDAGCGEGEATCIYSRIPGVEVLAADFSPTRLKKAQVTLAGCRNVTLEKIDFLDECCLSADFDVVISQRFLINVTTWELQKTVLIRLLSLLKPSGRLIMLEGSHQGATTLNEFRALWKLAPIEIRWHNLFLDDDRLMEFMERSGFLCVSQDGLGAYFLLSRGLRPIFEKDLNWNCEFNRIASSEPLRESLNFDSSRFSRLKLWVFERPVREPCPGC